MQQDVIRSRFGQVMNHVLVIPKCIVIHLMAIAISWDTYHPGNC